jgi:predicted PurR-regulated permease PerM
MPDDGIPDDAPPEPAAPLAELPITPAMSVAGKPAPVVLSSGAPTPSTFASKGVAHLKTASIALLHWWRAVTIEGLCVGVLWLIGLLLLQVPLAPVWALVAALMTLIPNFGGVISLLGPAFSILVSQPSMYRLCILLGMYAVIVIIDQLLLQPLIMKRVTRVPIWASILAPIVLGIIIPFWGILLAPPLLAVVYAFRRPRARPLP